MNVLVLLLLLLQILLISSQVFNQYDSNHNIIVNNCNSSSSISIINHIRHAIQTADKDVYLSLNHDWLDSILINNKRSNVRCMTLHELDKMNSIDTNHVDMTKVNEDDEVIEIIYVPVTNAITVTSYTSGYIDTFLTLNPCWIVLQEPDLFNDNDDEIMEKRIKSRLTNKPLIFIRLPTYPYGPTCRLYTHLTRRQFPKNCPGKDDLYYHYLQNYGFGGELSKMIKTFLYNLYSSSSKVYATPRHEGYQFLWANSNILKKNECPSTMYKENPLACSFISIAGCSVNDRVNEDQDWYDFEIDGNDDGKHKTLQHLGINVNVLKKYRDGPGPAVHNEGRDMKYSANVWVTLRTYAFILRPNYRTRSLIRKATRRIKTLSSNGASKHNYFNHQNRLGVQVKNQCIGIHVRNHDVLSDFRNEIKLDRSLNAHIHAAKNLSIALAINDFFLATDNGTLFKIAPIEYPSYRWQGQSRNIKDKFDMHTTHLSEDEPQKELAALIADFLQMGKCHGIVGASDSSLTLIYQIYNCNNMVRSSCSSFYDIKKLEGQGILPYIGKKARPDTIASFDYPWKD